MNIFLKIKKFTEDHLKSKIAELPNLNLKFMIHQYVRPSSVQVCNSAHRVVRKRMRNAHLDALHKHEYWNKQTGSWELVAAVTM